MRGLAYTSLTLICEKTLWIISNSGGKAYLYVTRPTFSITSYSPMNLRLYLPFLPNLMTFFQGETVATPQPGPTRLVSPNRNPGDARLILFIYILFHFFFQNFCDLNPRLNPKGGSELEPGLLRRFQLSYQNIFFMLFLFRFSICAEAFSNGRPTSIYTS